MGGRKTDICLPFILTERHLLKPVRKDDVGGLLTKREASRNRLIGVPGQTTALRSATGTRPPGEVPAGVRVGRQRYIAALIGKICSTCPRAVDTRWR